jgi:hypothetical protein
MFNETEWIKLIFLLSDTQTWVDDLAKQAFDQLPVETKQRKTYYLTVTTTAHIIERHYSKINRHPHTGKFIIPLTEIISYIREAYNLPITPVTGSLNFSRCLTTDKIIGYDKNGEYTNLITIFTDAAGKIITAFPGQIHIL